MASNITLITGGIKSGKSSWSLQHGEQYGPSRAFIATATALDDEMKRRIDDHRNERRDRWTTFEEPRDIAGCIERISGRYSVILLDCLTMWVSNLLTVYNLQEDVIRSEQETLIKVLERETSPVVIITNEVGMGLVPPDRLSRKYQELLAAVNKRIAAAASRVYFMVSGIPQKIK